MKEIQKISILLPTFNVESTVRATLKSVEWADEIIVIDSFSNDDTIKIESKYGARIFQHEYINLNSTNEFNYITILDSTN